MNKTGHPSEATLFSVKSVQNITSIWDGSQQAKAMINLSFDDAVARLQLPDLARRIGIAGEIPERDGKTISCWFPENHPNGDRNPSFNLHSGLTRFKCFSCGIEGRGPDLIAHAL
jgi:hypothetical protein